MLFVADGMTGQDAVNAVEGFIRYIDFDGVILTKMDGDARGGAALSIREVTGKPILFVGTGEGVDAFERFYPDRNIFRRCPPKKLSGVYAVSGIQDMMDGNGKTEEKTDRSQSAACIPV